MRFFIVCICSLFIISCGSAPKQQTDIIDDFITKIFKSDSYTIENIETYMIPEYFKKKDTLSERNLQIHISYIEKITDEMRALLKENNFEYQIIPKDSEASKNYKNIKYTRNGKVFLFVCKEELIGAFIIEDKKLYSFLVNAFLIDNKNYVPYFFFERN